MCSGLLTTPQPKLTHYPSAASASPRRPPAGPRRGDRRRLSRPRGAWLHGRATAPRDAHGGIPGG